MVCDTKTLPGQTLTQRKAEVREAIANLAKALASGKVKPVIGPQGAIAFPGWLAADRGRVSDTCAYRLLSTSPTAMLAIQKAELLAGRSVDRKVVAVGAHSHDGGKSWHSHRG